MDVQSLGQNAPGAIRGCCFSCRKGIRRPASRHISGRGMKSSQTLSPDSRSSEGGLNGTHSPLMFRGVDGEQHGQGPWGDTCVWGGKTRHMESEHGLSFYLPSDLKTLFTELTGLP